MAGNDESNRIAAHRPANGSRRTWPPDRPGNVAIAARLTPRDRTDGTQNRSIPSGPIFEIECETGKFGVVTTQGSRQAIPGGAKVRDRLGIVDGEPCISGPARGPAEPPFEALDETGLGGHEFDRYDAPISGRQVNGTPRSLNHRRDDGWRVRVSRVMDHDVAGA